MRSDDVLDEARIALPDATTASRAARRYLARRFRDWPAETVDSVMITASELATNAVIHGAPPQWIAAELTDCGAVIEVGDASRSMPVMRDPSPDDGTGRGLRIVDGLADRWGVDVIEGQGKSVWFEMERWS